MIIKAVTLFLVGIIILGMFGKLRLKHIMPKRLTARKCKSCGAPIPGKGPCACKKQG